MDGKRGNRIERSENGEKNREERMSLYKVVGR